MNTGVMGARYEKYFLSCSESLANKESQHLGFYPTCNGSNEDIQNESKFHTGHSPNSNVDNPNYSNIVHIFSGTAY